MADLYMSKQYSEGRPSYPPQLFDFIASKTPCHDLAWDVATGTGQAARSLADIYKNVIATDKSPRQLEFTPKLPNITYKCTSPSMSTAELQEKIGLESSVDLVTVSQAMHWFDLSRFYAQVKWVLKKPDGVLAAWCYTSPEVNPGVDSVFDRLYNVDAVPYFEMGPRRMVDERYETIDFPFERVDDQHNGPLRFECEKVMDLELYLTYLRSWSSYQAAKEEGVELLSNDVIKGFTVAWGGDAKIERVVKFPIYLRIGRVG